MTVVSIILVLFGVFVALTAFQAYKETKADNEKWNGGICPDCGTKWRKSTKKAPDEWVIYTCPKKECPKEIMVTRAMK